jgi:biopolymer transport protein ExbD
MKLKRLRKSRKGRIEIIPMIDVMFFLLATFMLASIFTQKLNSVPINLTKGVAEKTLIEKQITISIDSNNLIYVNKQPVAFDEIANHLKPMILNAKNNVIIIAADKNSFQGTVTKAMLKAREAGGEHFSIMVEN